MSHKPWRLLLSFWATSLALFILAADSNAQETLQPCAPAIPRSAELERTINHPPFAFPNFGDALLKQADNDFLGVHPDS